MPLSVALPFLHIVRLFEFVQMLFFLQGFGQRSLLVHSLEGRYPSYIGNQPGVGNLQSRNNENSDIVDEIVSKYSLPSVNENSIASFVKLRNNKTHSGTVEWGESAKIYTPLFAIVYASFFKYIKLPDEVIKSTLLQIF